MDKALNQVEQEKSVGQNTVQELKAELFGVRNELRESHKKQKKIGEQISKNFAYRINSLRKES